MNNLNNFSNAMNLSQNGGILLKNKKKPMRLGFNPDEEDETNRTYYLDDLIFEEARRRGINPNPSPTDYAKEYLTITALKDGCSVFYGQRSSKISPKPFEPGLGPSPSLGGGKSAASLSKGGGDTIPQYVIVQWYDDYFDIRKRYPEGDADGYYAWEYVTDGYDTSNVDWNYDDEGAYFYTDTEFPEIGSGIYRKWGDEYEYCDYYQIVGDNNHVPDIPEPHKLNLEYITTYNQEDEEIDFFVRYPNQDYTDEKTQEKNYAWLYVGGGYDSNDDGEIDINDADWYRLNQSNKWIQYFPVAHANVGDVFETVYYSELVHLEVLETGITGVTDINYIEYSKDKKNWDYYLPLFSDETPYPLYNEITHLNKDEKVYLRGWNAAYGGLKGGDSLSIFCMDAVDEEQGSGLIIDDGSLVHAGDDQPIGAISFDGSDSGGKPFITDDDTTESLDEGVVTRFEISGNIMSLVDGDEFATITTLDDCMFIFSGLFSKNEGLQSAKNLVLPATELSTSCYSYMFSGCTNLTTAPELLAPVLVDSCYEGMFYDCKKLNYIKCLATDISANDCTYNWVEGVETVGGTFIVAEGMEDKWEQNSPNGNPWIEPKPMDIPNYTVFTALEDSTIGLANLAESNTISVVHEGDETETLPYHALYCSLDGGKGWYPLYPDGKGGMVLNAGDKMYVAGILPDDIELSYDNRTQFDITGKVSVSGNINALYNYNDLNITVRDYQYCYLFMECDGLYDASQLTLPSMQLTEYCYISMFSRCSNLTKAPTILPATTLSEGCYLGMFNQCSNLTTAPELPATELVDYCYRELFNCCYKLNYIKVGFHSWPVNQYGEYTDTHNWMQGVSGKGRFDCPSDLEEIAGVSNIPFGWGVNGPAGDPTNYITFTALESNSTIGLVRLSTNQTLLYSLDNGQTWDDFDTTSNITLNNVGDKAYFAGILRGDNEDYSDPRTGTEKHNFTQFSITGNVSVSGNLNSLWNYTNTTLQSVYSRCARKLFMDCTGLTDAGGLVIQTAKTGSGYSFMFKGCTNLTVVPQLPSTDLGGDCYYGMFYGCTGLVTIPVNLLPATKLAGSCYEQMFYDCENLTTIPELPATTIEQYCYNYMFFNCRSLTGEMILPAERLINRCYYRMLAYCENLHYIKCLATSIQNTDCVDNWVTGIASEGTFVKHPDMTSWSTGNNGIPSGWTVEDAVID